MANYISVTLDHSELFGQEEPPKKYNTALLLNAVTDEVDKVYLDTEIWVIEGDQSSIHAEVDGQSETEVIEIINNIIHSTRQKWLESVVE